MVEIYKQAKNMEKANCDLADTELFVTLKDYKELQQQLQAHKDKEDELREWLLTEIRWQNGIREILVEKKLREFLQILNEGDK